MISRRMVSSVAFGAIALLAGCATAPKEPQSMIAPNANFSEFETFSLLHQPSAENPMIGPAGIAKGHAQVRSLRQNFGRKIDEPLDLDEIGLP